MIDGLETTTWAKGIAGGKSIIHISQLGVAFGKFFQ
jgi:hypothetical protein